ncbi:MAG: aldo/keto reductase [Deltaproteobacteria bacterium]|nr:aldo/keto reductase [Deltaproteobacteria bacterium]MBW2361304.1 aldo/keto reductase [Deltaproteobacteria bacterium]
MQRRRLGADGPEISALGFGLMSLSSTYGPSEDEESLRAIHRALDCGIDFLDTAEIYGGGHNERLLSEVLKERRDEVVLATKFGLQLADGRLQANGRPDNVRRAIDGSLERLGVDHVDLYTLHRKDPDVPIEETVGTMGDLVRAGKVRQVGLSAIAPDTLRRAQTEHPIAAVQSEYSLFTRTPEEGVLDACEELGVTFVAYSPLGRGMLTGAIRSGDDLAEQDLRRSTPRFQGESLEENVALVERVCEIAAEKGVEPGQLALAWLLHRRGFIVPLFGTRKPERVASNAEAASVSLQADEMARIEAAVPPGAVRGAALPDFMECLNEG